MFVAPGATATLCLRGGFPFWNVKKIEICCFKLKIKIEFFVFAVEQTRVQCVQKLVKFVVRAAPAPVVGRFGTLSVKNRNF